MLTWRCLVFCFVLVKVVVGKSVGAEGKGVCIFVVQHEWVEPVLARRHMMRCPVNFPCRVNPESVS